MYFKFQLLYSSILLGSSSDFLTLCFYIDQLFVIYVATIFFELLSVFWFWLCLIFEIQTLKNCILHITIYLSISSFNVSVFRVIARRPLISLRGLSTFFYYYGFISYICVSDFALTQVVYVMYD